MYLIKHNFRSSNRSLSEATN